MYKNTLYFVPTNGRKDIITLFDSVRKDLTRDGHLGPSVSYLMLPERDIFLAHLDQTFVGAGIFVVEGRSHSFLELQERARSHGLEARVWEQDISPLSWYS